MKFLEKFEAPEKFSKLKKEHISCSNLSHQVLFVKTFSLLLPGWEVFPHPLQIQACIVNQLLLEESPQVTTELLSDLRT